MTSQQTAVSAWGGISGAESTTFSCSDVTMPISTSERLLSNSTAHTLVDLTVHHHQACRLSHAFDCLCATGAKPTVEFVEILVAPAHKPLRLFGDHFFNERIGLSIKTAGVGGGRFAEQVLDRRLEARGQPMQGARVGAAAAAGQHVFQRALGQSGTASQFGDRQAISGHQATDVCGNVRHESERCRLRGTKIALFVLTNL